MTTTPAPWKTVGHIVWHHHRDGGTRIADCENEADALLISAAPELLEALEAITAAFIADRDALLESVSDRQGHIPYEDDQEDVEAMDAIIGKAQAAITKAKGEN